MEGSESFLVLETQFRESVDDVLTGDLVTGGEFLVLDQVENFCFLGVECFQELNPDLFFLDLLDAGLRCTGATVVSDVTDGLGDHLVDQAVLSEENLMLDTLGFLTGGVGGLAGREDEPNALGEVTQQNLGQCFRLVLLKDLNLLCFGLGIGYTLKNLGDEGLAYGQFRS